MLVYDGRFQAESGWNILTVLELVRLVGYLKEIYYDAR
jgi:hypothetical protein